VHVQIISSQLPKATTDFIFTQTKTIPAHTIMPPSPKIVTITEEPIRLGQLLKLANLVQDGFEAKIQIQNGEVLVNGVVETRRGRKLNGGDQVEMGGVAYLITYNKKE
jgi:ribosome-associated protein